MFDPVNKDSEQNVTEEVEKETETACVNEVEETTKEGPRLMEPWDRKKEEEEDGSFSIDNGTEIVVGVRLVRFNYVSPVTLGPNL